MSCVGKEPERRVSQAVCDQASIMSDNESLSTGVKVYMTKKKALWQEFEHGFSQQGSSSEGNPFMDVPSARVLSHSRARPSGRLMEEVDSDDDDAEVDSEETQVLTTTVATDTEPDLESHPG